KNAKLAKAVSSIFIAFLLLCVGQYSSRRSTSVLRVLVPHKRDACATADWPHKLGINQTIAQYLTPDSPREACHFDKIPVKGDACARGAFRLLQRHQWRYDARS